MLKNLFLISFFLISNLVIAQEWSEPVLISTMQGYNDNPDFTIDKNGVIHCVWSHQIEDNYRKIYYSKSIDEGETWSEPEDISLNDTMWMSKPHVACDSESNLYVSYNYNTANYYDTQIHLRKFNGISWGDSVVISEGYPGSNNGDLLIDKNGRLYVFWYYGELFYYKYYENDSWSNAICPYASDNYHSLIKAVCDSSNNLHCLGSFHYSGQNHYEDKIIYFKYNFNSDVWSEITFLSKSTMGWGHDMALDKVGYPHVVWKQRSYASDYDSTLYRYFNGNTWSEPIVINIKKNSDYQVIAIDSLNQINIVIKEDIDTKEQLVHYTKYQNSFKRSVIDTAHLAIAQSIIHNFRNLLYVIYLKCNESSTVNVMFIKSDVSTNIFGNNFSNISESLIKNYPNPFSEATQFRYTLNKNGYTTLKIYNLNGQLINILVSEKQKIGTYNVNWNGTDKNGNKLPAGIYLYRLQVDEYCMTKSLIMAY